MSKCEDFDVTETLLAFKNGKKCTFDHDKYYRDLLKSGKWKNKGYTRFTCPKCDNCVNNDVITREFMGGEYDDILLKYLIYDKPYPRMVENMLPFLKY